MVHRLQKREPTALLHPSFLLIGNNQTPPEDRRFPPLLLRCFFPLIPRVLPIKQKENSQGGHQSSPLDVTVTRQRKLPSFSYFILVMDQTSTEPHLLCFCSSSFSLRSNRFPSPLDLWPPTTSEKPKEVCRRSTPSRDLFDHQITILTARIRVLSSPSRSLKAKSKPTKGSRSRQTPCPSSRFPICTAVPVDLPFARQFLVHSDGDDDYSRSKWVWLFGEDEATRIWLFNLIDSG
ncbi:unnamed protein product [Lactuca virosa]|uniref:Uncharacterized protein n=1 Tax=Lactuca virosa TaxID=75947 RepID=A0AAU9NJK0_9ASTR|nr:unnamed protein product [Lactuca virosa]